MTLQTSRLALLYQADTCWQDSMFGLLFLTLSITTLSNKPPMFNALPFIKDSVEFVVCCISKMCQLRAALQITEENHKMNIYSNVNLVSSSGKGISMLIALYFQQDVSFECVYHLIVH